MSIYMQAFVQECDFTGTTYSTPVEGAWLLVKGASGRVCPVMFAGPEYVEGNGLEVVDYDTAVDLVQNMEGAFVGF